MVLPTSSKHKKEMSDFSISLYGDNGHRTQELVFNQTLSPRGFIPDNISGIQAVKKQIPSIIIEELQSERSTSTMRKSNN